MCTDPDDTFSAQDAAMIRGKAWKFGDNVNTDEIIPARYLNVSDAAELARHCMEDAEPDFPRKLAEGVVSKGDLIVAGENFGCGSSREHAPIAIKAAGISCVIAKTFARIFFRNAINIGLPIVESRQAAEEIRAGDVVVVDLEAGRILDETLGKEFPVPPFPPEMQQIIDAGGLMPFVKQSLAQQNRAKRTAAKRRS